MDDRIAKLIKLLDEDKSHPADAHTRWKQSLEDDLNFSGVKFPDLNLKSFQFAGFNLSDATFTKTQLTNANFNGVTLNGAHFVEVEAPSIGFQSAVLHNATFDGGNLSEADFRYAELRGAKFLGPDLSGAVFASADISSADMSPRKVNSKTNFESMKSVEGCRIDRYTLVSLSQYGGLTTGDRMRMIIRDDVARLKSEYSGFLQWLHWFALIVFVFPYAWFLVKSWAVARFQGDEQIGIALWEAFARYIVTGGEGWREGWSLNLYSFVPFVAAAGYNVLRLILLVKTKRLELQESISGLPAVFTLQGRWGFWYKAARIGFWLNLLIVAFHSYHFLQMTVPIE